MAALCWSSREEIPHAQGKRNSSKTVGVARGHQRKNTLKPYSQNTSESNHTRTTALSNSMKLSHAPGATHDGRVMVERSDRMWSTGEGNGKPLQYSCLENPMNSMKRQNDRILKEDLPKLEVVKQEMARVNVDILGINKLKWTGMGEFSSDDHCIYYCGQESLRRNGAAIMVSKESKIQYLDAISKTTE